MNYHTDDFTEEGYSRLIHKARDHWRFESFGTDCDSPHVLWRHDIDISAHRALRLAKIEAEHNVRTTYFFLLGSEFYNCHEPGVRNIIRQIVGLGHDLGLHFDFGNYDVSCIESLEHYVAFEKGILAELAGAEPVAISYHNPTTNLSLSFDQPYLSGLVNTYGKPVRETYQYVSDSNGYWRFQRLVDVLEEREHDRLHVLTHPAWWTPEAMAPRERITRAVDGRAQAVHAQYDAFLEKHGRTNVR